jgi:hypothetical protein
LNRLSAGVGLPASTTGQRRGWGFRQCCALLAAFNAAGQRGLLIADVAEVLELGGNALSRQQQAHRYIRAAQAGGWCLARTRDADGQRMRYRLLGTRDPR